MTAAKAPAAHEDTSEKLIEVRGLLSQFGDRTIHENLDLTVERGEVLGVVGGSGTGKTVLLNSIIGLKEPDGGSVSILGYDRATITEADEADVERRTGILFQQGALFSSLSVIDNVASPLVEHTELSADIIRELAEMKIAMVGLKPEAHHLKPAELSGGMRKRVGLARALALDPELLFLDEPTAGVDPIGSRQIRDLILKLRERGITVFLCSHLLEQVQEVCDHVGIIFKGKMVREGKLDDLIAIEDQTEIVLRDASPRSNDFSSAKPPKQTTDEQHERNDFKRLTRQPDCGDRPAHLHATGANEGLLFPGCVRGDSDSRQLA